MTERVDSAVPGTHPDLETLSSLLDDAVDRSRSDATGDSATGDSATGDSATGDSANGPWHDHVAECAACAAHLRELDHTRAAVAASVPPIDAARREQAIAGALAAWDDSRVDGRRAGRRERRPNTYAVLTSIAAAVVVVVAAASVLTRGDAVTRIPGGDKTATAMAGSQGDAANQRAAVVFAGDLGEINDAATLTAKVIKTSNAAPPQAVIMSTTIAGPNSGATGSAIVQAEAQAIANSGAMADASASVDASPKAVASPYSASQSPGALAERLACDEKIVRQYSPGGELVFQATARRQGVDALVYGFISTPPPGSSAVPADPKAAATATLTLVMVARDDCRVLIEVVAP